MVLLNRVSCYLIFRVLLGLWCVVVYFAASGYGDSGTEFEVEYEVNSSSISVRPQIDGVDATPGISLTVISGAISISVDSLKESVQGTFRRSKGFQEKPICVIEKSNRLAVGSVVLVAISVVGCALNLVGLARLVANFVESLGPPTYEHVVEYSELAQWLAMTLRMSRVWELLYGLVVLLSSITSPHFETKSVYKSRVMVRCLKYAVMCTCFAHARSVICRFVTQPGWGH